MAQSLPGYLDQIKRSKPEDLVVVSRELDPAYEITALVVKLEREGRVTRMMGTEDSQWTRSSTSSTSTAIGTSKS